MTESLAELTARIRACRTCRVDPGGTPLPHEPRPVLRPSPTARLCIVGQAPGVRVHASGQPFTDPSGERLRAWMGVSCEEFYDDARVAIAPMGFCFPGLDERGADLPPRRECAPLWRAQLFARMPQIELLLLVGRYAQLWHLGPACRKTLGETVENWREYLTPQSGPAALPLPHPSWRNNAWLKRHPFFESELVPCLRREVERLLRSG